MNSNSTLPTRSTSSTRRRRGLLTGAVAVAGLAVVASTAAPVVAGNLVTSKDLAKGSVTSKAIAKKTVKSKHLADGAVKAAKIKDGNVTGTKLADGSVTGTKLAPGSVTRGHLASDLQPLWAVVWGGLSITRGKGAVSVAYEGVSSQVRVTFDRDVSQCSYTATMSALTSQSPEQNGFLNVSPFTGDPKAVLVRTRDTDGSPAAKGFTVQVWC